MGLKTINDSQFLCPISAKTSIFMICDVQRRLRDGMYGFDAMIAQIDKMLKAAPMVGLRTMATEQVPKGGCEPHGKRDTTVPELDLSSLPKELNLGTFKKSMFTMIFDDTEEVLQRVKPKVAILAGMEAHVCILHTALSLLRAGVEVYVLVDAITSSHRQETMIAVDRMRQAGAIITTSEAILMEFVEDSADPVFKELCDMVADTKKASKNALDVLLEPHMRGQLSR
ncbi:Isochorismatase-like protein [Dioszegia hungarica]|uniref:Isochorismatase-like protein n=1 Tax=Dioszegia hungarica TaxID=4972 RepID=A0AA38LWE4_9TREE|nr:Isochorismatase-like protein [Dioszegia hungarica]KAI9636511.1 Isochorismatase-like protein [Dioszegia hungarica]